VPNHYKQIGQQNDQLFTKFVPYKFQEMVLILKQKLLKIQFNLWIYQYMPLQFLNKKEHDQDLEQQQYTELLIKKILTTINSNHESEVQKQNLVLKFIIEDNQMVFEMTRARQVLFQRFVPVRMQQYMQQQLQDLSYQNKVLQQQQQQQQLLQQQQQQQQQQLLQQQQQQQQQQQHQQQQQQQQQQLLQQLLQQQQQQQLQQQQQQQYQRQQYEQQQYEQQQQQYEQQQYQQQQQLQQLQQQQQYYYNNNNNYN
jgi:PAX-interacting protein 1